MNTYGGAPSRILLDARTRITSIDGTLANELGHGAEDLLEGPFSAIVAPDDLHDVGKDLIAIIDGDKPVVTARRRLVRADGQELEVVLSAEARTTDDDDFAGFSVAVLLDDEDHGPPVMPDHLRRLSVAAALIDADGEIVDTNLAWGQLFASASAVAPGGDAYQLVHEDERDLLRERVGEIARGAVSSTRVELRCLADGVGFWCRMALAPFDNGASHLTVTADDISEEHLTNRVLTANEALFRSLAEASPVGLARLAPDLTITYTSPSWRRVTGETETEPHLDLGAVLHPDDRDEAIATCRARIATASAEPVVARLAETDRSPDAVPRWASLRLGEVSDPEVGLIGYVVTAEEVTEIVTASESQGQLAGVIETTTDLVGIADLRSGALLYLNAAAQAAFGPLGEPPRHVTEIYADGALDFYLDEVYPVLRRGETWTGDLEMVRHDGATMRVRQTVAAEVGADGEPQRASVLGRDVSDEQQAMDELAYKATHDALTGLPNRSLLIDHIELALARSARDRRPVGLLFVDLDRFKIVNDTYGHDAGDELLQALAQRMSGVLRPSDTVARLGGDEFVVLCEDIDGENDALTIADRIRDAIEQTPMPFAPDAEIRVGASIGIAISNGGTSREPASLLQRADAAMYRAKNAGRGRTELFDDVRRDRAKRRAEQTDQLAQAIEDGALDVHYQPIVDLRSGRVVGVEALVRWLHPTNGLLGPSEFLPLAVQTGMAADLDALVLRRATADAAGWQERLGPSSPRVHVNIDGATLASGRLASALDEATALSGLPAAKICIEVTEPYVMANGDDIIGRIADIRSRDVLIAIDDVGTGATQLPRLGRFAVDILKIDGTLTGGLGSDEASQQLVAAIVGLARPLGLEVGAECVEDAAAIPILRELGVHVAQGHVFSAALPAAKAELLLNLRSTLARAD